MKGDVQGTGHLPSLPVHQPDSPFHFFCDRSRGGRESFNFPPAVADAPMRTGKAWTPAQRMLAVTLLLYAHPEWDVRFGRARAVDIALRLAPAFARDVLSEMAGRSWIFSSSAVRDYAAVKVRRIRSSTVKPRRGGHYRLRPRSLQQGGRRRG